MSATQLATICECQGKLDWLPLVTDNSGMELTGHIHNGVVVFDGAVSLPEGAGVTVVLQTKPKIRVAKNPTRVEFPLVRSSSPGSVHLTNTEIGEILDEEDVSS